MQKASREAKQNTSWINPNEAYEDDLEAFVLGVVTDRKTEEVLDGPAATVAQDGFFNGLSQLVLKGTAPGVPDLYRGAELLDVSLVDPDNRRPVDYAHRQQLLDELTPLLDAPEAEPLRDMVEACDPEMKFYLLARLLRLRQAYPELSASAAYTALEPDGSGAAHWIAFARQHDGDALVTAVPRFPASFDPSVPVTLSLPSELAGRTWTEWLTATSVALDDTWTLGTTPLPWAVLVSD
jgi:(1->4)-alpha-D-glucan 1-alpha-D-glucosylmutase